MSTMSLPATDIFPSLIVKLPLGKLALAMSVPCPVPTSTRVLRKRTATGSNIAASKKPKLEMDNDENGEYDDSHNATFVTDKSRKTSHKNVSSNNPTFATNKSQESSAKMTSPYYMDNTSSKPAPHGMPAVWADKRQQLCETLPQYKAYQSGAYTNNQTLHGFLIDAEVGPLDVFDLQIIITTVGGDRAKDDNGNTIQKVSSDSKASGLAAMRAMEQGRAVLLIAGQGNRLSPSKLPHYYNVLGWFKVTDVWRETALKIWKVRFEKVDLTERSWWAAAGTYSAGTYPAGTAPLLVDYENPKAEIHICEACNKASKQLYEQGWVCLQPTCGQYFKFAVDTVNLTKLAYTSAFLLERSPFTGQQPGPLVPTLPTQEQVDHAGTTAYDKVFRGGLVCPQCGCCSRRVQWHQWECENTICNFTHRLLANTLSVDEAIAMDAPHQHSQFCHQSILTREFVAGLYNVYEYILPGPDGTIAGWIRLFKSNDLINQQPDGPNDLFKQMQQDHFKLTRNPARCKGSIGEMLTNHFASNWGALYKYGVTPTTTGFSEAAPVILKALKRLTWAGEQALSEEMDAFKVFNELLLLGYFEKGKIDYHDDGEKTLGPTVASLSLGANATMKFRPKKKSCVGQGKSAKGNKSDYLKITLNHGDLLVMHGTAIHKEYEHAVEPHGKLRFALTSRFVIPELMSTPQDTEFARVGGILPEGHEQYDYDGDVNAQPIAEPDNKAEIILAAMIAHLTRLGLTKTEIVAQLENAVQNLSIPNSNPNKRSRMD